MFFTIPGELISIVTFPGVIMHEFAHRFFCDLTRVPVYAVCYFRVNKTAGYVIHAPTKSVIKSFLITCGPFILNTILCAMLLAFPMVSYQFGKPEHYTLTIVLGWLGFSVGSHAIPSKPDINNFIETLDNSTALFLFRMPLYLFSMILLLFNILSVVWFDFIFAYGVGLLGTCLVGKFF